MNTILVATEPSNLRPKPATECDIHNHKLQYVCDFMYEY